MTEDRDKEMLGTIYLLLEKTKAELDLISAPYDMSMYEMDPKDPDHDWPGLVLYDEEYGDVLLTYKPCEIEGKTIYTLYLKAWDGEKKTESGDEVALYFKEWHLPLPGQELSEPYLSYVLKLFNKTRKDGFFDRGKGMVSGYIKETSRLNGLQSVLSQIGVESWYSFDGSTFPCLWIFDGYEGEDNENAGCLIRLSYISLEEDDSVWLLVAECSRTSEEKRYPAAPELKAPVTEYLILEFGGLLDSSKYGRLLELIENYT